MVVAMVVFVAILMSALAMAFLIIEALPISENYVEFVFGGITILGMASCWLLGKKYLKQPSELILTDETLTFRRNKFEKVLPIHEIESYKYKLVNGVRLIIWTRFNESLSITANDIFCDYEELEAFCLDFDKFIDSISPQGKKSHRANLARETDVETSDEIKIETNQNAENSTLQGAITNHERSVQAEPEMRRTRKIPKRKKSFYERKFALPVLFTMTAIAISVIIHAIIVDANIPGTLIAGIGGIGAMWGAYYNHQRK